MERTITVHGTGTATASPDAVIISGGFSGLFASYDEAVGASSGILSSIRREVVAAGFDAADLKTVRVSVNPEYTYDKDGKSSFSGYRFNHDISITEDSDGETVGRVLGALVRCDGAPEFRLEYTVRDRSGPMAEARADAVADARCKAEQLADAAGVRLGEIVTIEYGSGCDAGRPVLRSVACMNMDAVPDDMRFTDSVTIVWSIS